MHAFLDIIILHAYSSINLEVPHPEEIPGQWPGACTSSEQWGQLSLV